jgi:hypothetical protein
MLQRLDSLQEVVHDRMEILEHLQRMTGLYGEASIVIASF